MKKITIVGSGGVGSQVAYLLASRKLVERIVLLDILKGMAQGRAMDIYQSLPLEHGFVDVIGTDDYAKTKNSHLVIITASLVLKPGMTREDLAVKNKPIIESVVKKIVKHSPDCILIVVSNPLDVMAKVALKTSGFPKKRVIGMAGILDSTRFRTFIAQAVKTDTRKVKAMVIGSHNETMVPLVELARVGSIPITKLLPRKKIANIVKRVRYAAIEIIKLLKTGSTIFAPALSIYEMVDAILKDKKQVMPCSVLLEGEYGVKNLFIGVPAVIGKKGWEKVIELKLSVKERDQFLASVDYQRKIFRKIGI
ncbi:malate dehydrogenase [Candidatus Roizmanbacteria bacterium RIFCSPHIGHO2_01_FULL_39_8]|uniref:Malate dehydrogenase n=3 Tax=Candidatus Roizmaniibacteriota TaxID=1752723 RepID=A0A1F7GJU2_9BACT|nr:MAG: malate dehydrogenase [Candidatus Roizmanbacteria bacterium RIFCSPHIGHO2_01_FULL_39_8]OGK27877.1 MAG: malate dehydrogenase [Candidatus Roizmanbacteria bacterium RIFCSPHIGHO2_02_FULL_39_9]OGK35781.1 MAG: malate dehydrogenase [Candidatus Roizmanbacteria bacterium RIFCSPHIGHO2_12_FULL_39_8]